VRKVHFIQADVFSDSPFGGNPVVVIPDPGPMAAEQMQALARGMSFGETVFVVPATSDEAAFALRCYTPTTQMSYSGHALLGASYVMYSEGRLAVEKPVCDILVEIQGALKSVRLVSEGGVVVRVSTVDDPPQFGPIIEDYARIAGALSMDAMDIIHTGLPVQTVRTSLSTVIVPVHSLHTVREMMPLGQTVDELLQIAGAELLLVFAHETLSPENDVHVRVFAPPVGLDEDPASGSANGALAAYLLENGVLRAAPDAVLRSEQGTETGRPSVIELRVDPSTTPATIRVGGRVARSVEGSVFY
jgi:trans-2,3-dihydro-3-hydroxyanthranilate isomerase